MSLSVTISVQDAAEEQIADFIMIIHEKNANERDHGSSSLNLFSAEEKAQKEDVQNRDDKKYQKRLLQRKRKTDEATHEIELSERKKIQQAQLSKSILQEKRSIDKP